MDGFYVAAEVCAESVDDVRAAVAGGADRIELCAHLACGGLTPSPREMAAARGAASLPIFAMLRPRPGGFEYQVAEIDALLRQVEPLRAAGADGFVFGSVAQGGPADEQLRAVIAAVAPLPLVFHRAFDGCEDQAAALESLIAAGCARVLTSGDPRGVEHGVERLRALVQQAGARIEVMPGGGVRARNAAALVAATGARSLHFSAKPVYGAPLRADDVRAVVRALRGA